MMHFPNLSELQILALVKWRECVASWPLVVYTDNNATHDVLISSTARNLVGLLLVKLYIFVEALAKCYPWSIGVPSPSNLADHPSPLFRCL